MVVSILLTFQAFCKDMSRIEQSDKSKEFFFQSFQNSSKKYDTVPKETQLEPWKKYRDAAIWHLLCLENSISANDILIYWEIIDNLIDLSLRSALVLLQNRYKYHINNLCIDTKKKRRIQFYQ